MADRLIINWNTLPKMLTPKASAQWPKIVTPDTKFKAEGEYSINLKFTGQEAEDLMEFYDSNYTTFLEDALEQLGKRKLKEHGSRPYKPALDGEENEIPGEFIFSFKTAAARKDKTTETFTPLRLPVFDPAGKPVTQEVLGGSVCQVGFRLRPWYTPGLGFGLKAELQAVQVHELVTAGGQSADAYGFATDGEAFAQDETNDEVEVTELAEEDF